MEGVYQICVCVCVCVWSPIANHVDSEIRGGKKKRKEKPTLSLIATFYLPKFWRERDRGREREEETEETPFNSAYKGSD